jgi:hypothetical protein
VVQPNFANPPTSLLVKDSTCTRFVALGGAEIGVEGSGTTSVTIEDSLRFRVHEWYRHRASRTHTHKGENQEQQRYQ